MKLANVKDSETAEINSLLDEIKAIKPEEVFVVFLKRGDYFTRSNGTFSRIRALGALAILQHDMLSKDVPE